jgi:hypothetical protein
MSLQLLLQKAETSSPTAAEAGRLTEAARELLLASP